MARAGVWGGYEKEDQRLQEQVSYPLVPRAPLALDCILLPAKEVTPFDELAFVFVGTGNQWG